MRHFLPVKPTALVNGKNQKKNRLLYLVDLFFRVREQVGEVRQDLAVEHHLRLLVRPRHDVAHRPQSCRLIGGGGEQSDENLTELHSVTI